MSDNTWMHRGVRVLVRPLAGTAVTPNQLTSARLLTGLGAATAFATGVDAWMNAGGALFLLSMLLDRADGALARMTGKTSRFGRYYDILADACCDVAALAAIGVALSGGALGALAILLGLIAGLSVAAIFYLIVRMEQDLGEGGGAVAGFAGFDPDDAMVLIPVALWLGYGEALLVAAAALAPLSALCIALGFKRRRAARAATEATRPNSSQRDG